MSEQPTKLMQPIATNTRPTERTNGDLRQISTQNAVGNAHNATPKANSTIFIYNSSLDLGVVQDEAASRFQTELGRIGDGTSDRQVIATPAARCRMCIPPAMPHGKASIDFTGTRAMRQMLFGEICATILQLDLISDIFTPYLPSNSETFHPANGS